MYVFSQIIISPQIVTELCIFFPLFCDGTFLLVFISYLLCVFFFFLMNIICSIISLRILKFFLVVSILFIWHESVSGVLMLLLPSSVLVFMYSGILVYKFISRFSLSLLWFPQPAENRLPRLPSVSPIPPSST